MIIWLYGQPGAGKTTIANGLLKYFSAECYVFHIDGDKLRATLNNKDYTEAGRRRQNEAIVDIAKYLNSENGKVIISAVGPYKKYRDILKEENNAKLFYLTARNERPREENRCAFFEEPVMNEGKVEFAIDTTETSVEDCVKFILEQI